MRTRTINVVLPEPIAAAAVPDVESWIYFVSESIVDFEVVHTVAGAQSIDITFDAGTSEQYVRDAVLQAFTDSVIVTLPESAADPSIVWRSRRQHARPLANFKMLRDRGWVETAHPGLVTLTGPLLDLIEYFDDALRSLLSARFRCERHRYSSLVPAHVLQEGRYYKSFPHQVMWASRLPNEVGSYRAFEESAEEHELRSDDLDEHATTSDMCLSPTVCFHTYHHFRGQQLTAPVTAITAAGKVFRHESRYVEGLVRLTDFTMREIVLLGERDPVEQARWEVLGVVGDWIDSLGLNGHCQPSNDPFFGSDQVPLQKVAQRSLALKLELLLPITLRRTLAVASFNLHHQLFGEAFSIATADGEPAWSACAGVGMERLAYAFLCQHGVHPRNWPDHVAAAVDAADSTI